MAEQKDKPQTPVSNGKRSHSTANNSDDSTMTPSTKRPRVEYDQTGYARGQIPEMLMGATDIYDGELMFL